MSVLRALCVIAAIVIAVGYTALWFAVPAPLERPCCTAPATLVLQAAFTRVPLPDWQSPYWRIGA